ncbi:unnamed protein product [Onchocerca ochengi]|uniref:Centromere protein J n=1 Tax=Onchocerca ochengi TaxID=42157 RepID=A0A182E8H8_ONCOC|nr:unnamed protein product [Onchocerca ochengi]
MVKKLREESVKQPVRQSHRIRVLNTRLGTPPKILLDMLRDHSSSTVKKSLPAVADVERIGLNCGALISINGSKQKLNTSSFSENVSQNTSRILKTVKKTAAFTSNESKKVKALRNSKNERKQILSKPLNNLLSKNRHSSRIRVPNSRFDYLLPGFLEQSGNGSGSGKRRDNMEKNRRKINSLMNMQLYDHSDRKVDKLPLISEEEEIIASSPKIMYDKSDMPFRPRHSERQRIPNKRLSFSDICPDIQAQKKPNKAKSKMGEEHVKVQKCKNSKKKPVNIPKTQLNVKATSRNFSLSSVVSNRQVHSSLEVPSVLYPYRPARSEALCVQPSSSMIKDYVSKKDVEELLVEINSALALITDEDYSELLEKIAHHLNNLHRENCRFRQTLHQLRSELDSLSNNSTINRCNLLMKQNSELREQKVLADIKCEAQMEEARKLLERIRVLEVRNKDLEDFQNRLVKQKRQKYLNGERKYPHIGLVNGLSRMEAEDLIDIELDSFILNGNGNEVVKNDKSNNDKVKWGNDAWMLHC